jgi:hypothetical protein
MKDKFKIKELGQEQVAGKMCTKYSMETTGFGQQAMPVTVWVWKGIILKRVSSFNDNTFTTVAVEINENAPINADVFTIPSNVTIQERQR